MAYTPEVIIAKVVANPSVLIIGLAAGYLLAKYQNRRKRGGMGGGGFM